MSSKLEEVRVLLARDRRLLEMTALFNGQNLKEQFPELSWEDRAALARFAHSRVARLEQATSQEAGREAAFDKLPRTVQLKSGEQSELDEVTRAAEPESNKQPEGQARVSAGQPLNSELEKTQTTPQSLAEETGTVKPARRRERRRFLVGIAAIIMLGLVLLALRMPWLSEPVLDWVLDKVNTSFKETTQEPQNLPQNQDAPELKDSANPTSAAEPQSQSAPVTEKSVSPASIPGGQAQSAPEASDQATPPIAINEEIQDAFEATGQANPVGAGKAISSAPETRSEVNTEEVREVQSNLARLGYNPGPIDGILGPRTRAAIRAFQQDNKLPVDGDISATLRESLITTLSR